MRRGGRIFLLLGVIVLVLALFGLIYYLQQSGGQATQQGGPVVPPTAIPKVQVVTAKIDIPSGTVLTDTGALEQFLTTEEIPETDYNRDPGQYFTSPSELLNKVTIRDVPALEKVVRSAVVDTGLSFQIPPAQPGQPRPKAIPFEVDNLRGVADQIQPGDFVDVIASFDVGRSYFQPAPPAQPGAPPAYNQSEVTSQSTKTLLQNVRVLKILKPAVPPSGTPGPESQPAPAETQGQGGPAGTPGPREQGGSPNSFTADAKWILILAVTDQQAEVMRYAVEKGTAITLALRARGDTAPETTLGITLDALIARYGLPVPVPVGPAVAPPNAVNPPAATAVPPTVTP
jgi:pilus assembly protein CpaB